MMQHDQFHFKWWALFGIALLAFTAYLDATIVNTALPFIQDALKANILQLQWIANIFTVILSMTMIAIGKFADRWGRKKIFYLGVIVFALGALGAGFAKTVEILVVFRGIQALGASTIFVSSAALLSHVFPEQERIKAISIYSGVTGFGLMVGPFFGGILIGLLDWRWVFWINLPLIAIGLAACSFSLKEPTYEKQPTRIDWKGFFLLIFGLGALMYGIITGAQKNWSFILAWLFLGVGVIALALLLMLDRVRKNPLLDLHIFKDKLIVLAALACAIAGGVSTVFMFFDPLYLRTLRHLSPFFIGLLIAVIPAAQALISFVFQKAVKWLGVLNLLFIAVAIAFLAVAFHRCLYLHTSFLFLVLPFFLLGITWGLSSASMITGINQVIAPHQIGAAIGVISTIWNIGGAVLLAASTAVFDAVEKKGSFLSAFHRTIEFNIGVAACILAISFVLCIKLKNKKSQM